MEINNPMTNCFDIAIKVLKMFFFLFFTTKLAAKRCKQIVLNIASVYIGFHRHTTTTTAAMIT